MKECKKCYARLPLDSFHKHKGFSDGRRSVCKECSNNISREYYKKNREKHRVSVMRWQKNNPEKVNAYKEIYKEKRKEVNRRYVEMNRKKNKAHHKVGYAIFKGTLKKGKQCQVCGCTGKPMEAHHFDYDKPLEVVWMCQSCHKWVHRKKDILQEAI